MCELFLQRKGNPAHPVVDHLSAYSYWVVRPSGASSGGGLGAVVQMVSNGLLVWAISLHFVCRPRQLLEARVVRPIIDDARLQSTNMRVVFHCVSGVTRSAVFTWWLKYIRLLTQFTQHCQGMFAKCTSSFMITFP